MPRLNITRKRQSVDQPEASAKLKKNLTRSGQYWHNGVRYASCSEAACAELMERYIPGFKSVPEKTFQIIIYDYNKGTYKTVDFKVGGCLFEFHPPRFWKSGKRYGDFKDYSEWKAYRGRIKRAETNTQKKAIRALTRKLLNNNYYEKRMTAIESNPKFRGIELIVAASAEEVYKKVIKRFGQNYPSQKAFVAEFNAIRNLVYQRHHPDKKARQRDKRKKKAA